MNGLFSKWYKSTLPFNFFKLKTLQTLKIQKNDNREYL